MTTTKRCPECGGEYLTGVERCFDCDVALVDVVDEPDEALLDDGLVGAGILGGEGAGRIAPIAGIDDPDDELDDADDETG